MVSFSYRCPGRGGIPSLTAIASCGLPWIAKRGQASTTSQIVGVCAYGRQCR